MTTSNGFHSNMDDSRQSDFGCYEDTARSVEIVREENRDGNLGSFGFTIFQERPPRIGTVIPGGPADKAGLRKGDLVLAVNGEDITNVSHKEVTSIIKACKTQSVWLSVCEGDGTMNSSLGSTPPKSFFQSTPAILSESGGGSPTSSLRRIHQIQSSLGGNSPYNGSGDIQLTHHRSRGDLISRQSPPSRRPVPPQTESNYVTLMPPQSYTVTRMSTLVMYCGPVKIPTSWSSRGVSSLCIQECARQLLSKKKTNDFLKVQLEVSQSSLRISNLSGNVLVKHRRSELYYCGSCTNDEQYFAVVSKSDGDSNLPVADLCHIFKLTSDTKLSTYVIDRSKSSREVRSGSPSLVKSCIEITETISSIFQNEPKPKEKTEKTASTDNLEYGVVRGVSTLQLAGSLANGAPDQASPVLKRKKSNVIDLRTKSGSPTLSGGGPGHRRNRSISNPTDPATLFASQRVLHPSNSTGYIPSTGGEAVHTRMHSDGLVSSTGSNSSVRGRSNLLHSSLPRDDAKRISDCSFSSMSSDHSGRGSSTGSPMSTPSKSLSPTPVPPHIPRDYSPQRPLVQSRKSSAVSRGGAISPCGDNASHYGSKVQLRRQGSEGSIFDLTAALQMSPYHHLGLPSKNSGLSSSVDSIVTITTLAEDDVDLVVGRVAGWCGSFDRLLADPLGLQYFLQFLESEHSEENLLFWKDVEEYKKMQATTLTSASKKIYDEYLSSSAPHSINIDDIVLKNVEAKMDTPTITLFDEVQREIYHLMRMDCYPRFQKSPIIKESLLAEMEGRPLPIEAKQLVKPAQQNERRPSWGAKKKISLLDRLKGVSSTNHPPSNVPTITAPPPSNEPPRPPPSSTSFNSLSSLTQSLTKSSERRRSKKEKKAELKMTKSTSAEVSGYHPEDNLKHLQAHKGNLFEINLPNRISKIIEAPPKATVREALTNVLKKYNYSLDVMEVRLTSTLQTISVDSPASLLIGKHVSIMKSKHTVTATFPDQKEMILPADGSKTVRDMMDEVILMKGKADPYSVYVDGARAPLELDMSSSVLDGHTITIKYLSSSTPSSVTTSVPGNSLTEGYGGLEDLISEITRLSADTLSDQRSKQDADSKVGRSPKLFKKPKKTLSPSQSSLPKFGRTKSGATVSHTPPNPIPQTRSLSPPPNLTGSAPQQYYYPPPPASDPPNLSHGYLNKPVNGHWEYNHPSYHHHQRSGDAMSGVSLGSESSVDSITHELATDRRAANRMLLNQWVMQSSQTSSNNYGGPNYFPTALGSMDTLERNQAAGRQQLLMKRIELSDTSDIYRSHQQPQQQQGIITSPSAGSTTNNYPWKPVHHTKSMPGSRTRLMSSDHGSIVGDEHQFSDTGSMVSNSSSSRSVPPSRRPPPSPTTHFLVVEETTQSSESYV